MDVWRITAAVLRRWYVFLPLLVVTGLGAFVVGEGVKPQYEVTATAVLVPGTAESEIDNPYGSIDSTADVLAIVLEGPSNREAFEDRGLNPDYVIDPRSRSGILDVTVLSDTESESLATADEVLKTARQELSERQGAVGIPRNAQIQLQVLRAPAPSQVVTEGKNRNMAVVGIVGGALSLLVTLLFDDLVGLLRRRRRRRKERRTERVENVHEVTDRDNGETASSDESARQAPGKARPQASAEGEGTAQRGSTEPDGHEAASRGRA